MLIRDKGLRLMALDKRQDGALGMGSLRWWGPNPAAQGVRDDCLIERRIRRPGYGPSDPTKASPGPYCAQGTT